MATTARNTANEAASPKNCSDFSSVERTSGRNSRTVSMRWPGPSFTLTSSANSCDLLPATCRRYVARLPGPKSSLDATSAFAINTLGEAERKLPATSGSSANTSEMRGVFLPSSMVSPTFTLRRDARRSSTNTSPGFTSALKGTRSPAALRTSMDPRSGYGAFTALTSVSAESLPSGVSFEGALTILPKRVDCVTLRPSETACVVKFSGNGRSPEIITSAPRSTFAWFTNAPFTRSANIATAPTLATASASASTRMRASVERNSRRTNRKIRFIEPPCRATSAPHARSAQLAQGRA